MLYDVLLAGFRSNGAGPPGRVLERVLGLSAEQASDVLGRFPVRVAAGLEWSQAEQVAAQLLAAGAMAELVEAAVVMARPNAAGAPVAARYQIGDLDVRSAAQASRPPAEQLAVSARAAAASPQQAASASSWGPGGLSGVGDGFDEPQDGPALELDRDAGWISTAEAQARREKSAERSQEQRTSDGHARQSHARLPTKRELPARRNIFQRLGDALDAVAPYLGLGRVLSILVLTALVSLGVMAYARDAQALAELAGLRLPPPMTAITRTAMRRGADMIRLRAAPRPRSPSNVMAAASPSMLHPLVRLAPVPDQLKVAAYLRSRVPGVLALAAQWPDEAGAKFRRVECMLVEHPDPDTHERLARARVTALLRTGLWQDIPQSMHQAVADQVTQQRNKRGDELRFTPLCLAL